MKQITTLLLFIIILCVSVQSVFAQNVTTSVQGVLRDPQGRSVDDGTYELLFKLYTQATGGTAMWEETQSNVAVSHGVFSVKLGAINPISNLSATQTYYLGVTAPGAGELLPRVELTKTFAANTAASVTGISNVVPSEGNVGIGTTTPVSKLEVTGDVKISSGGKLYFPDNTFLASAQSGTAEQVTTSGDANVFADNDNNGSGSIILKTGASERARITNSGNIGIGINNPSALVELFTNTGDRKMLQIDEPGFNNYGMVFRYNVDGVLKLNTINAGIENTSQPAMAWNRGTGNVGIGMPNPSYKLDVAGDARVKNTFYVGDPAGKHIFMYNTGSLVDITSAGSPLTINHSSGNNTYINAGGGNVGIGTESPSHKLHVNGEMRVSKIWDDDVNYYIDINAGARTGGNWNFNGNVGIQTTNMNVPLRVVNAWCDGGWWYNASDRTLKNDIQDLSKYGLSTVMKLRPVSFSYKNDEKKNTQIGFIAQEVKEIVPEVVSGEEGSMGMSYGNLTAILVNAIKEQQKQIEELKAEIQELKKK